MQWASAVSSSPDIEEAVNEVCAAVRGELGDGRIDLLIPFVSRHHAGEYMRISDLLTEKLPAGAVLGCSAGGVIGGGHEVEDRPGLSLTAAILPDVRVDLFRFDRSEIPDLDSSPRLWEETTGVDAARVPSFILLTDPFSFDIDSFIRGLDFAFPESGKIGGLASAGTSPGENVLYLNDEIYRSGMIGAALHGKIKLDTVVAQGCRPIGSPLFVTKGEGNIIERLDEKAPIEILRELYAVLDPRDQELFQTSLFLGIVIEEFKQEYHQGDFLIRNIMGIDPSTGHLAVGTTVEENQVVQFHLRDAEASASDLDDMLLRYHSRRPDGHPAGSLLFSCLGRGNFLYGRPDHDTDAFRKHVGENVPLGGFFCNGEIGPVHGRTFVHGYTSSFGIFSEP